MRRPSSVPRKLAAGFGAVAVATTWFLWLRPTALGGAASYVVVDGHSMEPTYQNGDLVLVRKASSYQIGDIIAFHAGGTFNDPTRVIHRIVGDAGNGAFTTQGDNRDVTDPWEPTSDDIIGRAVLHLPLAGRMAELVTQPASFAALGAAAVVVGGERRRRRRRPGPYGRHAAPPTPVPEVRMSAPRPSSPPPDSSSRLGRHTQPRWAFIGLVATVLVALPVLAMAWSTLRAPDAIQQLDPVGSVDSGIDVGYHFTGARSAVYPNGEVGSARNPAGAVVPTGPLYSRLLDDLIVDLTFRTDATGTDQLDGTYVVDVKAETPDGWSTVLESIKATPFDGTATATAKVDLRDVERKVQAVSTLTGVGGDAYTITVAPRIELAGRSAAGQIQEQLDAPVTLKVADSLIDVTAADASMHKDLTRAVDAPARYGFGPLELSTQAARGLAGGLAMVLVAAIAWFASVLFGGVGLGEPARIAARYRSQIVDVAAAAAPPGPVVMVSAIDELARIAKVEQTVIVHEDLGDGAHRYRVFLGTVTYEYETAPEHAGAAADPVDATTDENGP